jgi:hypothetical protein
MNHEKTVHISMERTSHNRCCANFRKKSQKVTGIFSVQQKALPLRLPDCKRFAAVYTRNDGKIRHKKNILAPE